ncbi:MAG: hypothetical protein NZ518_00605 [Dehalococcoidia bacterium]|nr:hypothetical protein [Dehalococcoidia bacterium]
MATIAQHVDGCNRRRDIVASARRWLRDERAQPRPYLCHLRFGSWLASVDISKLARLLGVGVAQVREWLELRDAPDIELWPDLMDLSGVDCRDLLTFALSAVYGPGGPVRSDLGRRIVQVMGEP